MMNFNWNDLINESSAEVAPEMAFEHVKSERSMLTKKGDYLLARYDDKTWWPAEILYVSRVKLKLRWWHPLCRFQSSSPDKMNVCPLSNSGFWLTSNNQLWDRIRSLDLSIVESEKNTFFKSHFSNTKVFESTLIQTQFSNLLKKACSHIMFETKCLSLSQAILIGGYLDCEHDFDPTKVWPAKIVDKRGGLLVLNWHGSHDSKTFIRHFCDRRIHPLGSSEDLKLKYAPPNELVGALVINQLKSAFPNGFPIQSNKPLRSHEFKKGWRLEVVDPATHKNFRPGTVVKVFNDKYFLVHIDDLNNSKNNSNLLVVGYANNPLLLSASTCIIKGLPFKPPNGWNIPEQFTWAKYLLNIFSLDSVIYSKQKISTDKNNIDTITEINSSVFTSLNMDISCCPDDIFFKGLQSDSKKRQCETSLRPNVAEFLLGMKLEMVHPSSTFAKSQIYPPIVTATVVRIRGKLLWLLPDSNISGSSNYPLLTDATSCYIFPIGWSQFVNYPEFIPPKFYCDPYSYISTPIKTHLEKDGKNTTISICVNIKSSCYSGSFLNKEQVSKLPKRIGPGSIRLVLQKLLNLLIAASVRPIRTMRLFECDWLTSLLSNQEEAGKRRIINESNYKNMVESRHPAMDLVTIHCSGQGRSSFKLETIAEVCRESRALEEFCRQIALSLEACPYFLSVIPDHLWQSEEIDCPAQCKARLQSKIYDRIPTWRKRLQISFNNTLLHNNKTENSASTSEYHSLSTYQKDSFRIDPSQGILPPFFRVQISNNFSSPIVDLSSTNLLSINEKHNSVQTRTLRSRPGSQSADVDSVVSLKKTRTDHSEVFSNGDQDKLEPKNDIQFLRCVDLSLESNFDNEINRRSLEAAHVMQFCDIPQIQLSSNPINWTPSEVANYVKKTDCSRLWNSLENECVDGSAFMLLTLPVLHKIVGLRWADAIRMSRHVTAVKQAYIRQFSRNDPNDVIVQSITKTESCSEDDFAPRAKEQIRKRHSSVLARNGKDSLSAQNHQNI